MRKLFQSVLFLCLIAVLSACSYTAVVAPNAAANLSHQPDTLEIGPVNRSSAPFDDGLEEGLDTLPGIKVVKFFTGDEHGTTSLVLKGKVNNPAQRTGIYRLY